MATPVNHTHLLSGWRFTTLIVVTLMSAGGYLLFMIWGGWDGVIDAATRVGILGIAVALCLSLLNYGLRFVRWQHYLHVLSYRIPAFESLKIYIAGFALTTTPAKAGEMLRSLFLKDYGVTYHASFGAFLSERVSDLIAVLLLATLGLWEYPSARPICISTGIVIVVTLFVLQQQAWLRKIQKWSLRHLNRQLARSLYFFIKILIAFRECFSFKTLLFATGLGVIAWGAEGVAFYYLLSLLDVQIPVLIAVFIYAFAMLIGAVTFLPGGLGGTELTMLQLLILYHVPSADAVVATVLIRLSTLWFAVFLGLVTLPFIKQGQKGR